jgi:hypothetical protein
LPEKSLEVLRELGLEIQWIQSFVTDDKIYCIYYAPDESLIREHARRGGFRADRISAVRQLLDPVNSRRSRSRDALVPSRRRRSSAV